MRASTLVPASPDARRADATEDDTLLWTYPLVVPSHPHVRLLTAFSTVCSCSVLIRFVTMPSASVS